MKKTLFRIAAVMFLAAIAAPVAKSEDIKLTWADLGLDIDFFSDLTIEMPLEYIDCTVPLTQDGTSLHFKMWQQSITAPLATTWLLEDGNLSLRPGWRLSVEGNGIAIEYMRLHFSGTKPTVEDFTSDQADVTLSSGYVKFVPNQENGANITVAYQPYTDTTCTLRYLNVKYDVVTSSVEAPVADVEDEEAWFDLYGRRLSSAPTAAGIYLHGGVKVVVR